MIHPEAMLNGWAIALMRWLTEEMLWVACLLLVLGLVGALLDWRSRK